MSEANNLAERFFDRFAGAGRMHLEWVPGAAPEAGKKHKGRTFQVKGPLTAELWQQHLSGEKSIGVSPIMDDSTCRWGAIDVDRYDLDHGAVLNKVRAMGMPLTVCRTKSGGAHLYIFFKENVPAGSLLLLLQTWAVALGWPGVEIFPKQDKIIGDGHGSPINLPYFSGDATTRYAVGGEGALTTAQFLDAADAISTTLAIAEAVALPVDDLMADAPPCLQSLSMGGFPDGTRNKALFALGVYAKMRWPDEWPGYLEEMNRRFMAPGLGAEEVHGIIKSLRKKSYGYTCKEAPLIGACNREICKKNKYGICNGSDDNDDLGVELGTLRKIETDPVTWILPVNGVDVYLTTATFMEQKGWRGRCAETINVAPKWVKKWDNVVSLLLKTVEIIAAPADSGPEGEIMDHLENFCTMRQAAHKDDLLLGMPWVENGRVHFRAKDFRKALKREGYAAVSAAKDIWNIIAKNGGKEEFFHVKGKTVRTWSVPEFDRQDGGFALPTMPSGDF